MKSHAEGEGSMRNIRKAHPGRKKPVLQKAALTTKDSAEPGGGGKVAEL